MSTSAELDAILEEMRGVFAGVSPDAVGQLAQEVVGARRILVYGVGRTGLALQGFAMRLMHLGLDGHFVGQLSAPPVAAGDLLVCALALGKLPTGDAIIASARRAHARVAIITARPQLVSADLVIGLPAQTMADPMTSLLPLGSPFELALSLYCDLTVIELMRRLELGNDDLATRHANLL
ncbi:MAG: 6-phospho-3-hexuloisomerase [Casimicrobiaceae bacterium]